MYLRRHVVHGDLHFVAMLKLRKNNPSRNNACKRNSEIDANTDKVVGIALGLHSVTR